MAQKPALVTIAVLLLLGCSPAPGSQQAGIRYEVPSAHSQDDHPAPFPSELGATGTPAPTRVERLNPELSGEQLLRRFIDRIMAADTTIHPSPGPTPSSLAPISQPRPVITAQHIDLRTAQWVQDHLEQGWTGDLTMDSPVWVAEIEGMIPNAALPGSSQQPGMTRRIVMVLSAATGTMISMAAYQ